MALRGFFLCFFFSPRHLERKDGEEGWRGRTEIFRKQFLKLAKVINRLTNLTEVLLQSFNLPFYSLLVDVSSAIASGGKAPITSSSSL
jgi:hypothetical protein